VISISLGLLFIFICNSLPIYCSFSRSKKLFGDAGSSQSVIKCYSQFHA
jgi:hypothetical protein